MYAALRQLMPESFVTEWSATLLYQTQSYQSPCVETVMLANLLRTVVGRLRNVRFAGILSAVGNGAGLATWLASNLCDELPQFCFAGYGQSVSISQSVQQEGLTELSITTQDGESIDLRPLQDPYVWLNELIGVPAPASPEGGDGGGMDGLDAGTIAGIVPPPASPEGGDGGGMDGLDAGTIAGIVVGSAVLFCFIAAAAFWVIKSKRSVKVVAAPPPKEFLVGDSVFEEAGGTRSRAIPLAKLSKYLTKRGDMPLQKVQEMLNALDTNGDGSIDLDEWRKGFTSGLLGQPLPAAKGPDVEMSHVTSTPVVGM